MTATQRTTLLLTKRWTQLRPHPVQSQLFHSPTRFKIVPAGRRSGKTELYKRYQTLKLWDCLVNPRPWEDPRFFAGAPTRDQAKRIFWNDFKRLVPKPWIDGRPSESDLRIVTRWGAELWVVGLDRPERIEGTSWDGGGLDELANCFVRGTPVDTPNGPVPIEAIRIGDAVHNAAGIGYVRSLIRRSARSIAVVKVQSNSMVCSVDHRFMTRRGWVRAGDLKVGDCLVTHNEAVRVLRQDVHPEAEQAAIARVDRVEVHESGSPEFARISGGADTIVLYDVEVSGHPTYSVHGFLVHNCRPGAWDNHIRPALSDRKGWCWLLGVPDRDSEGQIEYKRMYDYAASGVDPEWQAFHWPSKDILDAAEIEAMLRTMDPEVAAQELGGQFVLAGGLAFPGFSPAVHVKDDITQYDPALPLCWSLDFNVNPMCSGVIQHKAGHVRVLREFALPDSSTDAACTAFLEWVEEAKINAHNVAIYGDPTGNARDSTSGKSDWAIVRQRLRHLEPVMRVPDAPMPIKDTLNALRARICNATGDVNLAVNSRCRRLIRELQELLWPSDLEAGHCTAWLRYFCARQYPVKAGIVIRPEDMRVG
jgi:hypothetical protein